MSDLHWTGAALLLAVAVLGGTSSRARRSTVVDWQDFAAQHGLEEDTERLADLAAYRPTARLAPAPVAIRPTGRGRRRAS